MAVVVRRALPGEWTTVRDVRLAALQEAPYAFGSTYERERNFDADTWRQRIDNPDGPTFLAFVDGKPVGIDGVYTDELGVTRLVAMWVDPNARRQGVALALTATVIDWVRTSGKEMLFLDVAADNTGAIALYEQLGFRWTGTRQALHSDPSRDTLEMKLDIARAR